MLTVAASAFLFLAIVAGALVLLGSGRVARREDEERIRRLREARVGDDAQRAALPSLKRPHSSIPTLRRLLSGSEWAEQVSTDLQQANIQLRAGEYLLLRALTGGVGFFIAALVTRFNAIGVVFALLVGVVGYAAPALYVKFLRHRRLVAIEKQLVEFLPLLASSLRSGFAFQQGVELAARQMGPPLANELSLLINDVNLGATMESALLDVGRRVGSTDLDMMITAILVQRTTGGNLSEVLEQAAETLRERERIRGDLQTLTAQHRLSATILSVYPIGIGLLLFAIMPSLWSLLFTERLGQIFLGVAFGLQLIGFLAMRRVMSIEV